MKDDEMNDIKILLILIPALPLAASLLTAALGPRVLRDEAIGPLSWHCRSLARPVFCCSIKCIRQSPEATKADAAKPALGYEKIVTLWSWAQTDGAYSWSPTADSRLQLSRRAGEIFM